MVSAVPVLKHFRICELMIKMMEKYGNCDVAAMKMNW